MYEISFEKRNRNIECRHKETGCVGGRRKIIKVGEELSQPDAKVVDVSGKLLFPDLLTDIPILTWRLLVL
ncbi:MAG: hypothetical protein ACLSGA_11450 [Ruminococcus sp.]